MLILNMVPDISLDVPEELDLEDLRGHGLQPGEEELPAGDQAPPSNTRLLFY